jgi:hypothetical protein
VSAHPGGDPGRTDVRVPARNPEGQSVWWLRIATVDETGMRKEGREKTRVPLVLVPWMW